MRRPDKFDYIGIALIALVVALWVAHFVLPPLPPVSDGALEATPALPALSETQPVRNPRSCLAPH